MLSSFLNFYFFKWFGKTPDIYIILLKHESFECKFFYVKENLKEVDLAVKEPALIAFKNGSTKMEKFLLFGQYVKDFCGIC